MDHYVGTVYRDLANAEDAAGLALFYGGEGNSSRDVPKALEAIASASAALDAARAKLEREAV